MLVAIFKNEFIYWLKNPSFYVYLCLFFILAVAAMAGASGAFGEESSNAARMANAPMNVYSFSLFFNKLLLFLLPAIVGTSVYKDYKSNMHSILYTYPFGKRDYLIGRFTGAFAVVALIAFAVEVGLFLGTKLPYSNPAQLAPFDAGVYLQAYSFYLLPNLLLFGVVVFTIVTMTRNIYAGFIALILLLLVKEMLTRLTGGPGANPAGLLLEPFGETATYHFTQNRTLSEQDILPIPFEPMIFYNRLLWLAVAAGIFYLVYRWFSFSQQGVSWSWNTGTPAQKPKYTAGSGIGIQIPGVSPDFSLIQQLTCVWRLSQSDFRYILKSGSFISILITGAVFIAILVLQTNPQTDMKTLPVTWVILGLPVIFFSLLINALTFLYAGILIHRARAARMSDLLHATPAPNWVFLSSKWIALVQMQLVLLLLIITAGIGIQAYEGYYHFDIGHYLFALFGIHLAGFLIWAFAALFVQALFTNPYLGLFFLVLGALGISAGSSLGPESLVFRFNDNPEPDFFLHYSEMNGYGHALLPYFLYKTYWGVFGLFLFFLTMLFWQRELTQSFMERIRLAKSRFSGALPYPLIVLFCAFLAFGIYLHIAVNKPENKAFSAQEENMLLAEFQQKYVGYDQIEQPRITSVFVKMDIYPQSCSFHAEGTYLLVNKTSVFIDTLLIKSGYDEITEILPEANLVSISTDSVFQFSVYKLVKAMAPNDSMTLRFRIKNKPNTLFTQHSNVLRNGSFIKSDIFPKLGYFAETVKPAPSDSNALGNHYQRIDSDEIDFEAIVSTSAAQTAIAPGYLQKSWMEKDRRYFHYKMDKKIKFVFGFNSGEYGVYKENLNDVDLRIYHHPRHTWCLPQMMEGLKAALTYNDTNFGRYQHRQAQIIEFPRSEGSYATTAANCIPVSEIRFVNDAGQTKNDNVDISFYVAAHEISHQWWGNQVIPADVAGASMITESVAEYITARVCEKKYGKKPADKFLKIQLSRYLKGRTTETQSEPPLSMVLPEQSYISYGKGAFALNTLSEYIGEENMNEALKAYLNKVKFQSPPYTTPLEMIAFLKAATPDSLQYLIGDLFETVTFYDNKILDAKTTALSDGKYQVDITFLIQKYRLDNNGNKVFTSAAGPSQTYRDPAAPNAVLSLPLADYIEVGVFDKNQQALYLKKHKITGIYNRLTLMLDQKPAETAIDPYTRLIDLDSADNRSGI